MQADLLRLKVTGIGVVSPYGTNVESLKALLAEGRPSFRRLRDYLGTDFAAQLSALSATPAIGTAAPERMVKNALTAMSNLQAERKFLPDDRGLSLAVLLPELAEDEGLGATQLSDIATDISTGVSALGIPHDSRNFFASGPPSFAQAIIDHQEKLALGTPLLVVATDSLACRTRLGARARSGRLFSARHPYASIPGEAAVAVLLEPGASGPEPYVGGSAIGIDPVTEASDGISTYQAQSDAARLALGELAGVVRRVLTDWNNSRFRASELAHCELRFGDYRDDQTEVIHLPLIFGDTGAATLPLAIVMSMGVAGDHLLLGAGFTNEFRSAVHLHVNDTP